LKTDSEFCEMVTCAGVYAAKWNTLQIMEKCIGSNVQGDFVECGVMAGAHPAIMLYMLQKVGMRNRKVHLFDSFQGIPRATENDCPDVQKTYGLKQGKMETSGASACTVQEVTDNLKKWGVWDENMVVFHKGWFEDTLAQDADKIDKIAFLRSDVDLYESTKLVYQHLYHKVVSGGFVCDDDIGLPGFPPACRVAMEEVIGKKTDWIHIVGHETTAWRWVE